MKLEEVEEKLGVIYSLASNTQSLVRVLLYGGPEPITLTSTQKDKIRAKIKSDVDKLVKIGNEILTGLG